MKKIIKKLLFGILILVLLFFVVIGFYLTYVQTNSNKAKEYLLEKYDLNVNKLFAIQYNELVYEDIADCNSLWIKQCTDDSDLLYKYVFIFNKKKIIVYENKEGEFIDNYEN